MTRDEVLRYDVWTDIHDNTQADALPDGEWVRYEDHAREIVRLREALKHETQWADAGIDSTEFWQKQRDDLAAKLSAVESERDALRDELTQQSITLSAEHQRAERILAALREPSEAVMAGAFSAGAIWDVVTHVRKTIQLAVAAAEQEVQGG